MANNIFFNGLTKPTREGTTLLQVKFIDEEGQESVWTPKWKQLRDIYSAAIDIERDNTDGQSQEFEFFKLQCQALALFCEIVQSPSR